MGAGSLILCVATLTVNTDAIAIERLQLPITLICTAAWVQRTDGYGLCIHTKMHTLIFCCNSCITSVSPGAGVVLSHRRS